MNHAPKNWLLNGLATLGLWLAVFTPPAYTADVAKDLATGSLGSLAEPPAAPRHTVVVIDPGHGGIDPGAISEDGIMEKDVVFAFAKTLQRDLSQLGQIEVHLTRDSDKFIALEDRAKLAQSTKADLFIALHADTLDEPSVRGTTIYTVSDKASDAVAETIAQKENQADMVGGIDLGKQKPLVAGTLINLMQRESKANAMIFALHTVDRLKNITQLSSVPIKSAAFVVLKDPDVPSVLIELGYLSNPADKANLLSSTWREATAAALAKAITSYFSPAASASLH